MRGKLTKLITAATMVATLVVSAIPFASAATTQLDTTKKVSITAQMYDNKKKGYEFELYQVAKLENSDSKATTEYKTFVTEISSEISKGDTKNALKKLDAMDTVPATAVSKGVYNTNGGTIKTFTGLDQGIYYLRATKYPAGVISVQNSIIALPYYDEAKQDWIYSSAPINLATKVNEGKPETHKEITNSTKNNVNFTDVSLGDTVNFKITSDKVGSTSIKQVKYIISDDMSKGLTLNNNSFDVYLENASGQKTKTLTKGADYAVNITKQVYGENTTFNVALSKSFLDKEDLYAASTAHVVVTYSAVLNEHAIVGAVGNPNTEIDLAYGNNSSEDKTPGNKVYVYTYGINVIKVNPQGEKLEGGVFALHTTKDSATRRENEIATATSDKNGKAVFLNAKGEEIKLASGTYYIVETKAPAGYTPYSGIVEVKIDATYKAAESNDTWVEKEPENGIATVSVTNTKGALPETGGYVQYLYITGGIAILAGMTLLAVTKTLKRKNKNVE